MSMLRISLLITATFIKLFGFIALLCALFTAASLRAIWMDITPHRIRPSIDGSTRSPISMVSFAAALLMGELWRIRMWTILTVITVSVSMASGLMYRTML
jgi:hypothetical protein